MAKITSKSGVCHEKKHVLLTATAASDATAMGGVMGNGRDQKIAVVILNSFYVLRSKLSSHQIAFKLDENIGKLLESFSWLAGLVSQKKKLYSFHPPYQILPKLSPTFSSEFPFNFGVIYPI